MTVMHHDASPCLHVVGMIAFVAKTFFEILYSFWKGTRTSPSSSRLPSPPQKAKRLKLGGTSRYRIKLRASKRSDYHSRNCASGRHGRTRRLPWRVLVHTSKMALPPPTPTVWERSLHNLHYLGRHVFSPMMKIFLAVLVMLFTISSVFIVDISIILFKVVVGGEFCSADQYDSPSLAGTMVSDDDDGSISSSSSFSFSSFDDDDSYTGVAAAADDDAPVATFGIPTRSKSKSTVNVRVSGGDGNDGDGDDRNGNNDDGDNSNSNDTNEANSGGGGGGLGGNNGRGNGDDDEGKEEGDEEEEEEYEDEDEDDEDEDDEDDDDEDDDVEQATSNNNTRNARSRLELSDGSAAVHSRRSRRSPRNFLASLSPRKFTRAATNRRREQQQQQIGGLSSTAFAAHDVLRGQGNHVCRHPGNIHYTNLVHEHKEEFKRETNQKQKTAIAKRIFDLINARTPPGRFLGTDKVTRQENAIVLDEKEAIKRIRQSFSGMNKKTKYTKKVSGKSNSTTTSTMTPASRVTRLESHELPPRASGRHEEGPSDGIIQVATEDANNSANTTSPATVPFASSSLYSSSSFYLSQMVDDDEIVEDDDDDDDDRPKRPKVNLNNTYLADKEKAQALYNAEIEHTRRASKTRKGYSFPNQTEVIQQLNAAVPGLTEHLAKHNYCIDPLGDNYRPSQYHNFMTKHLAAINSYNYTIGQGKAETVILKKERPPEAFITCDPDGTLRVDEARLPNFFLTDRPEFCVLLKQLREWVDKYNKKDPPKHATPKHCLLFKHPIIWFTVFARQLSIDDLLRWLKATPEFLHRSIKNFNETKTFGTTKGRNCFFNSAIGPMKKGPKLSSEDSLIPLWLCPFSQVDEKDDCIAFQEDMRILCKRCVDFPKIVLQRDMRHHRMEPVMEYYSKGGALDRSEESDDNRTPNRNRFSPVKILSRFTDSIKTTVSGCINIPSSSDSSSRGSRDMTDLREVVRDLGAHYRIGNTTAQTTNSVVAVAAPSSHWEKLTKHNKRYHRTDTTIYEVPVAASNDGSNEPTMVEDTADDDTISKDFVNRAQDSSTASTNEQETEGTHSADVSNFDKVSAKQAIMVKMFGKFANAMEEGISDYQEEVANDEALLTKEIEDLNDIIRKHEDTIHRAENKVAGLENHIEKDAARLVKQVGVIQDKAAEVNNLTTHVASLEKAIDQDTQRIKILTADVAALHDRNMLSTKQHEVAMDASNARSAASKELIRQRTDEINTLRATSEESEAKVSNLTTRVTEFVESEALLKAEIANHNDTFRQNEATIHQHEATIRQSTVDLARRKETIRKHEDSINTLTGENANLLGTIHNLKDDVSTFEQTIQTDATRHGEAIADRDEMIRVQGVSFATLQGAHTQLQQKYNNVLEMMQEVMARNNRENNQANNNNQG